MVESLHHMLDGLLRNAGEVAALGKILPHQAVGVLVEAKTSVASQPDTWTEYAGLANQEEVYVSLDKQEILKMLDAIEAAAEKARAEGAFVAIAGD